MNHPDEILVYFNDICADNDIEYPEFLKKCINSEISIENRYLLYTMRMVEDARRDVENDYCGYWNYRCLEDCESDYYDALDDDFNDRKKSILNNYFKLVKFLKDITCKDITDHIFSYTHTI